MAAEKLDNFSIRFLKSSGDIKDKSIQRWHLAFIPDASGSSIQDLDGDTFVSVEYYPDEDIIRFNTGDTQGGVPGERVTIDASGLAVASGLQLGLDGRIGDTCWRYNATTAYMEGWVDNIKRIEL